MGAVPDGEGEGEGEGEGKGEGEGEGDVPGVSTAKAHKPGSGFSPGRFVNGSPGRSKTSSSCGMALKGAMSTPTALMLLNRAG